MKDYHIDIFWSEEDACYVANVPDLKHCSAVGDSPEEALRELMIAKQAWLDAAAEQGKPIPRPEYVPLLSQGSYGQRPRPRKRSASQPA